jgi:ribosome biogenesis protein SSF1/2
MNNFTTPQSDNDTPSSDSKDSKNKVPRHLEALTTTMFQSLFPPINPQQTPVSSIRRVLLLNREVSTDPKDAGTYIINLRHYAITTKTRGLSKPLRRLNAAEKLLHESSTSSKRHKAGLPNLGKLEDIADYMIGGENGEGYVTDGMTSGSEVDTDAEVEMLESTTRKVLNNKARQRARAAESADGKCHSGVEKRAVKLVELGPRLRLRMTKVEEGVCDGKVMWHEYIHKTPAQLKEMEKVWAARRKEKEERKRIQKENVERKRKAKGLGSKKDGKDGEDDDEDGEGYDDMDVDEWDSEGLEGDGEMELNEKAEAEGEWEDEAAEIAAG